MIDFKRAHPQANIQSLRYSILSNIEWSYILYSAFLFLLKKKNLIIFWLYKIPLDSSYLSCLSSLIDYNPFIGLNDGLLFLYIKLDGLLK